MIFRPFKREDTGGTGPDAKKFQKLCIRFPGWRVFGTWTAMSAVPFAVADKGKSSCFASPLSRPPP
jgi:hypothetical protein